MASLELKNVTKVFNGNIAAVDKVSFKIEENEFVVLAGSSGCGKTTILRMIAGLEKPTSGEIIIDDSVVNNLPPKDRDIGIVFQNQALYPHLNVYENIAFGLRLRKYDKKEIENRVDSVSELLEIKELINRKPQELSGGQKQRVALGRAMVRKPKIFLFDEPLSNLDVLLRKTLRRELKNLHAKLNTPFIYVTHDPIDVINLGQKIIILKEGKVQQIGSLEEIKEKPVNQYIKKFITIT
ncbi:MAG: ABC transporter ATP-binding protein [Ignavibacteriales bacterium]|nr:ABC transporter ATP-binding protein [Ignavibacteriales bacterium]